MVVFCVVFDVNGLLCVEYCCYNIVGIMLGDDYVVMNQVLCWCYGKVIEESKILDVILIDGGKGQFVQVKVVFVELDVFWDKYCFLLFGVVKGVDRKVGLEIFFFELEGEGFSLLLDLLVLYVIQYICDELYDYVIGGYCKKCVKVKNISMLEIIEGVGFKCCQMLLKYMGGL